MKIAFDAQLLAEEQKTGISLMAQRLIEGLCAMDEDEIILNYFSLGHNQAGTERIRVLQDFGCQLNECKWFNNTLYKMLWNFIPLPYQWFHGSAADITLFMNYYVPPGVQGKVITTVHDMTYMAFPKTMNTKTRTMMDLSLRKSCERADKIITISEFSKEEIIKYLGINDERIAVLYCGVDKDIFHPDYPPAAVQKVAEKHGLKEKYFLYIGTLEPRKNLEKLIEAYSLLKQREENIPKLVLAGRKGWLYDAIFGKVADSGLEQDVVFTGYVDNAELPLLLKGAFAFVFPSIYEGFGIPPLEAMACGVPVITSNVASLPEVTGDAALLIDPASAEDLAEAMGRLYRDETLRLELSQQGLERSRQFSWTRSAQQLRSICYSL